ncbi:MAG: O-antigen ligase family protein [Acidimicrobiales bacterium]
MTTLARPDNPSRPAVLTRPGLAERAYVILTAFLLLYSLPNEWFVATVSGGTGNAAVNESQGALPTVIFAGLFAVALVQLSGNWHLVRQLARAEPLLPLFIALAPLSVLWSADPNVTARRSIAYALTSMFGYYLVVRFDLKEILRLTGVAMMAGTLLNIAFVQALPQYGIAESTSSIDAGAWTGITTTKNSLGAVTVLSIVVFLVLARADRRHRVIYYGFALLNAYIVINANSKTAYLNMFLLSGLLVVYMLFRSRKTLFGAVAFAMLGAAAIAFAFVTTNIGVLAERLDRDITLSGRVPLWEDLLTEVGRSPMLGQGWSAYWNGFDSPSHEIWIQHPWLPPHAHNAFLDYALQIGIIGLLLFSLLLIRSIIRGTRHIRDNPGPLPLFPLTMFSLTMLASITESGIIGRRMVWALFVVCVLTVTRDSRDAIRSRQAEEDLATTPGRG